MNIKIKYIITILFVLLFINLIKSEDSDADTDTSESNDDGNSRGSGSVWSDGNGDLNSVEFCPAPKKLCEKGSYRDTDERIHLVSYCIEEDEECCGCNSVSTPHRTNNGTVYLKVGDCFGCSKSSSCYFDIFKDGLQRYCVSSSFRLSSNPISSLLLLLISIVALLI